MDARTNQSLWRAGNEALISYGDHTNAQLLIRYGFAPFTVNDANDISDETNRTSSVDLFVPLPKTAKDHAKKLAVLEAAGLGAVASGAEPFVLKRGNATTLLPAALLGAMRVISADGTKDMASLAQVPMPPAPCLSCLSRIS